MNKKISSNDLRSNRWFAKNDLRSFGHRSRVKQMGLNNEDYIGKPIIGIINPWNDLNTCHTHFPQRVQDIKKGVYLGGGYPVEIPVMSLGEQLMKPTTMFYRNLLALEVEEIVKSYPIDGIILMGGCDKTTPALIMGALSLNLPTIYFPAGAMSRAQWRGESLGSGTDVWKYWEEKRVGKISNEDWEDLENSIARSPGTCMSMGTAATMMSVADSMGLCITGASSIPAVDSNHIRMATNTGKLIIDLVWSDTRISDILNRQSFENAIITCTAIGGSTNAVIHLLAMARRANVDLSLEDFDQIAAKIPLLANVKPTGKFVMDDFYFAGGLKALMNEIRTHLHLSLLTVNGKTIAENIENSTVWNKEVIHSLDDPIKGKGSLVVLKGNIASDGCVLKPLAMENKFRQHCGKVWAYEHIQEMKIAMEDESIDFHQNDILVLKNTGPVGATGMPEWGQLPLPKKLVKQGVRDMLRISDARMSGTSYGACILHVSPESAIGGAFCAVQTGDKIEIDVDKREINLLISNQDLQERLKAFKPTQNKAEQSGYMQLFNAQIEQANLGCDFKNSQKSTKGFDEPEVF